MKGLLNKLKFKTLFVEHGEKLVFGFLCLFVLYALYSTQWSGYEKTPEELVKTAEEAERKVQNAPFPEEKQKEYTPSTYQLVATQMHAPMDRSGLEYLTPMSFPLHSKREPNRDPELGKVIYMIADAGVAPIGLMPDPVDPEDPDAAGAATAAPTPPGSPGRRPTGKGKNQDAEDGLTGLAGPMGPMGPMDMMMGQNMMGSSVKVRGQRFVAVRGVFNLYDQSVKYMKALHTETRDEAAQYIEIIDLKLQRQKIVGGPDPFAGPWEDVDLERADEILTEAASFAVEPHISDIVSDVITMAIPARMDGEWDEKYVSHPLLQNFKLSKEAQELEKKINAAAVSMFMEVNGEDTTGGGRRRGFAGHTYDARGMRQQLMGAGMGNEMYQRAGVNNMKGGMSPPGMSPPGMGDMNRMMPPGAGRQMASPMMGGRTMPNQGMTGRPMSPPGMNAMMQAGGMPLPPSMMGGNMAGMAGMGGMGGGNMAQILGSNAAGYLLLFRFFDFDVSPGEAYRYRVKLVLFNPNFQAPLETVVDASVIDGEDRETDWSDPSPATAVPLDTEVYLANVELPRSNRKVQARLNVIQFDPTLGTYVKGDVTIEPGSYVGGLVGDVEVVDLEESVREKRKLNLKTNEMLLDLMVQPELVPDEHKELKLQGGRNSNRKTGIDLPDLALVSDEYGRTHLLDKISSKASFNLANTKYEDYLKKFDYLKPPEGGTDSLDGALGIGPGGAEGPDAKMMMMMQSGGGNPLRKQKGGRGMRGGMGATSATSGFGATSATSGYGPGAGSKGKGKGR